MNTYNSCLSWKEHTTILYEQIPQEEVKVVSEVYSKLNYQKQLLSFLRLEKKRKVDRKAQLRISISISIRLFA